MSSILRDMLGDDDEYSEEEYFDDYYGEEQEESYNEENEQETISKGVDLLSLAKKPKLSSKKKKKKQKKPAERKIEYGDMEEFEYYENLRLGHVKTEVKPLESIKYNIHAVECVRMSIDTLPISEVKILTVNPAWINRKLEIIKEYKKIRDNNNRFRFDEDEIDKNICEKNTGIRIDKFIEGTSRSGLGVNLEYCLMRENYAIAVIRDRIFIHGGDNVKSTLSDLVVIQPSAGTIVLYKDLHNSSLYCTKHYYNNSKQICDIPPINNHAMVNVGETGLLIFGAASHPSPNNDYESYIHRDGFYDSRQRIPGPTEMHLYYITIDPTDYKKIHYGMKKRYQNDVESYNEYRHPIRKESNGQFVTLRQNFTVTAVGNTYYLFGGKINTFSQDELYQFELQNQSISYECVKINKQSQSIHEVWPPARHGHAAAAINQDIFIYGGRGNGNILFNDLYVFDTIKRKWFEIDVTTALPPRVSHMGNLFNYSNQYLFFYGGRGMNPETKTERIYNTIYRYDTGQREWTLIKVMGLISNSFRPLHKATCNHQCVVLPDSVMYKISGYFHEGTEAKIIPEIMTLKNVSDPGQNLMFIEYLKEKMEEGFMCDVVFRVREKLGAEVDTIVEYKAHRAIISARCQLLNELIEKSTNIITDTTDFDRELIVVDILDCNAAVFKAFLDYIYSGTIHLDGVENIAALVEFSTKWAPDHQHYITKICSPSHNVFLDTADDILNRLQDDLLKLINNEQNSDVTLILGEAENQELVYGHRFILCRAQLFKSMFLSGMQETYSNVIELPEYSKDVMLALLRFLYTDNIIITPSICVGSLVYAQQFGLIEIANFCRSMAARYLTKENVFAVMEIAEVYSDGPLKRSCMKFIQENFVELNFTDAYKKMSEEVRSKIEAAYEKKKKQSKKKF